MSVKNMSIGSASAVSSILKLVMLVFAEKNPMSKPGLGRATGCSILFMK